MPKNRSENLQINPLPLFSRKLFNKVIKRLLFWRRRNYHFSRIVMNDHIRKFIQENNIRGKILDVGGGTNSELYQQNFKEYVSINIDPNVNATYIMDSNAMKFEEMSYDAVICMQVLEHVPTPLMTLKESHRVLKEHGFLIISVPFLIEVHNFPGDFWRFTKHGLELILSEAGFHNIKTFSWGNKKSVIAYLKFKGWSTTRLGKKLVSIPNDDRYPIVVWAYAEK